MHASVEHRREHLRLLGIFHFVLAGLTLVGSFLPLLWLGLASAWWPELTADARSGGEVPSALTGAFGMALVGFGVLLAWIWAGLLCIAGRSLMVARRFMLCAVVAAVACLSFPLGTILGVATLAVLYRRGTRALFGMSG